MAGEVGADTVPDLRQCTFERDRGTVEMISGKRQEERKDLASMPYNCQKSDMRRVVRDH